MKKTGTQPKEQSDILHEEGRGNSVNRHRFIFPITPRYFVAVAYMQYYLSVDINSLMFKLTISMINLQAKVNKKDTLIFPSVFLLSCVHTSTLCQ